ncbi:MAG: HIRAN domain-containing protein [Kiritimatiellae bacterium]|nr:HIRAN domain-containing protein [Kiritimatiellia bacterium]
MIWFLDVTGDRYDLDHLSRKSCMVFQCRDAGQISNVRVRGFTDNYPYFDLKCKIGGFEIEASHKLSYMIGVGGIRVSCPSGWEWRTIPDVVPENVGYSLLSDGSDVKFIPKSEIKRFMGEAKIELWLTDPRLHYLALLSLLNEPEQIGRWTRIIPTWRQAIDILLRFGLFRSFLLGKVSIHEDEYDCMTRFYRSLQVSTPEEYLEKFSPVAADPLNWAEPPEQVSGKDIFLLNCHISGTSHTEAAKERASDIQPGLPLTLRREPANNFDKQAIAVFLPNGERIGYIPQKHNPVTSRLMDAGKLIFAKVTEAELKGNWLRARMDVFMKD